MLKRDARAFGSLALILASTSVGAAPPAGFEQRVEQLRKEYGVPGVTIAVVENGKPTLAHGWGVRDITTNQPVDADTIFFTGSTGKACTNAALATLVDQGKIKWDDKVIDHMPDFRMWDPWVTREMTIRDLLVHRSGLGLGEGDLLFVPNSDLSRKETVRRIRYLKPATSFRSGYAYDNILYMAAGQLIEEISGETWEQYIREHVFAPLGMNHSTVSDAEFMANPDHARPHSRTGGAIVGLGTQTPLDQNATISQNSAPAGGLAISANDMTRWLLTQLGHGKIPGSDKRLFSDEQSKEMWTPVTIQEASDYPAQFDVTEPNFYLYGLGWDVQDYRGAKLIWHGGAVFGSLAAVALLPDRDVGLYIAVNSEEGEMVRGLLYELLDHYLGLPRGQWPEKFHEFKMGRLNAAAKAVRAAESKPAKAGPSLPLDRYTGDYADPWYGTIKVRKTPSGLTIEFPHSTGMSGPLTHYQYDTFRTNPSLKWIEPAYVTFSLGSDGKVDRITMKAVSPTADFSFDYQDLLFTPAGGEK
jgi:CubicO group peptidase (beta-lactamase class C family)